MRRVRKGTVLLALLLGAPLPAAPPTSFTPRELWEAWPEARVSPPDPWSFRRPALDATLEKLSREYPGLFRVAGEGRSGEGRRLALLALGRGPLKVLLWSQMHGDEPTATSALVDLLSFLGKKRGSAAEERLLSSLTIYLLPMLNPDGAERGTRRNAQGIDINRDALRLATPEGRFLKEVRDRFRPSLGYNLHNLSPLTRAGPNGEQVALAFLSVAGDEAETETEGRRTTKRLAVFLRDALAPWAAGKLARYDADYTARAFGDAMTRWGTATLLIETGGLGGPDEAATLVRLNFTALLGSLLALADGAIDSLDPKAYDALPLVVREGFVDVLIREATVLNGAGLPPYVADVGLVKPHEFGGTAGRGRPGVVDIGDLSTFSGKEVVEAKGKLLVPAPAGGEEGWRKTLARLRVEGLADGSGRLLFPPGQLSEEVKAWTAGGPLLLPGFGGDLLLLAPAGEGAWSVVRRLGPSGR